MRPTTMSDYSVEHELIDFLGRTHDRIDQSYRSITKRSKEDPSTAGEQGEENWKDIFTDWLPQTLHVKSRCRILGHKGNPSRQADVVILRPEYPKHLLSENYVMAGGVLAAFECKLTLRSGHMKEFYDKSVSYKSVSEAQTGHTFHELQRPYLTGLLAHKNAWGGGDEAIEIIEGQIRSCDYEQIPHPALMPDLICIADLATWSVQKHVHGPGYPMGNEHSSDPSVITGYGRHHKAIRQLTPVGALISSLWTKLSYEQPAMAPIAHYFREADATGVMPFMPRSWSKGVFSTALLKEMEARPSMPGMGNSWCELTVM